MTTQDDFIESCGLLLEGHGERVGCMARYIMGLVTQSTALPSDLIITGAGRCHDVGKIFIPDSILDAPRRLTSDEQQLMALHPVLGHYALQSMAKKHGWLISQDIYDGVLFHHECWNGSGYPFGLKGNDIPLCARILSVADIIDAVLSPRSYKPAYPVSAVRTIIARLSGTTLDPTLAAIAISNLPQIIREGRMAGYTENYPLLCRTRATLSHLPLTAGLLEDVSITLATNKSLTQSKDDLRR